MLNKEEEVRILIIYCLILWRWLYKIRWRWRVEKTHTRNTLSLLALLSCKHAPQHLTPYTLTPLYTSNIFLYPPYLTA